MKKPKSLVQGGGVIFGRTIGLHLLTEDEVTVIAQVINALRSPDQWPEGFAIIPTSKVKGMALESAH